MLAKKLFIILISFLLIFFIGCLGSDDDTDDGTDDTSSSDETEEDEETTSDYTNSGIAGAQAAVATTGVANNVANIGTAIPGAIPGFYMKKNATAPPSTFFSTDIAGAEAGSDAASGYVAFTGIHSNEAVKVRIKMADDDYVDKTFMTSPTAKQIATLGTYDWSDVFASSPPAAADFVSFITSSTYENITTLSDYIIWAMLGDYIVTQSQGSLQTGQLTEPDPTSDDVIAYYEALVTLATSTDIAASGSLTITIPANSTTGKPDDTGGTGSGSITYGDLTITITIALTFDAGSLDTLTITGTTAEEYTISITCDSTGAGTGTVTDSAGTQLATITIDADGSATVTDTAGLSETLSTS